MERQSNGMLCVENERTSTTNGTVQAEKIKTSQLSPSYHVQLLSS